MSSESIAITGVREPARPLGMVLHTWITTVDHKRIGILYILFALLFLVIGGIEATIMRIQLLFPHNHFVSPQFFNQMFTMHGTTMIFFVGHAARLRIRQLPDPADDRRSRYGFPAPQRLRLLAHRFRRLLLYFSFRRWQRTLRRRARAGFWLVRLCALNFAQPSRRGTAPIIGL